MGKILYVFAFALTNICCLHATINSELTELPDILCSPPKCDEPGCSLDYSTEPCPSCRCGRQGVPDIMCSPPKCDAGCTIDFSSKPCPSCSCGSLGIPDIMCSPPKCDTGCTIDPSTKPCPSCTCRHQKTLPTLQCSPPKCEPGCHIDYSTTPCPSCSCDTSDVPRIMCSPPKCELPCRMDYSTKPCPTCSCDNKRNPLSIRCSMPKCVAPCQIDYSTRPCPSCKCNSDAPLASNPYTVYVADPFCRQLKCGYDCEREREPTGTERCPMCLCPGRTGEKIKCIAMHCELPCRFEKFSPYGCPTCICHPLPCPELTCGPTTVEEQLPHERCPKCVPKATEGS